MSEYIPRNLFHCFVLGAAVKYGLPGKEGPGIAVRASGQSIAWKRDEVRTQARGDPGNGGCALHPATDCFIRGKSETKIQPNGYKCICSINKTDNVRVT